MNNKSNKVNAAIIIIGNEILSGRTQDTNLAYISKWLNIHGVRVKGVRIIPDLENSLIVLLVNASRTILFAKIVFTPTKLSLTLINSKVYLSFRFGLLDCEIHILLFSPSKPNIEPELGQ